jgi:hypothetical protein
MLTDPYVIAAFALLGLFYLIFSSDVIDGYDPHRDVENLLEWESLHIKALTAPLVIIFSWVARMIVPDTVRLFSGTITLPFYGEQQVFGFLLFTVVLSILISVVWIVPVFNTLKQTSDLNSTETFYRISIIFTSIGFGGFLALFIYFTNPFGLENIERLYQPFINFAVTNAIPNYEALLGIEIAQVTPVISATIGIFKNNTFIALKGSVLTGLIVLGVGLVGSTVQLKKIGLVIAYFGFMVTVTNIMLVSGVIAGIMLRQQAITGNLLAPPLLILAVFGFHTSREYASFVWSGFGAALLVYGYIDGDFDLSFFGGQRLLYGLLGGFGIAAFLEVFLSSGVVSFLTGFYTLSRDIPPVAPGDVVGVLIVAIPTAIATAVGLSFVERRLAQLLT